MVDRGIQNLETQKATSLPRNMIARSRYPMTYLNFYSPNQLVHIKMSFKSVEDSVDKAS